MSVCVSVLLICSLVVITMISYHFMYNTLCTGFKHVYCVSKLVSYLTYCTLIANEWL